MWNFHFHFHGDFSMGKSCNRTTPYDEQCHCNSTEKRIFFACHLHLGATKWNRLQIVIVALGTFPLQTAYVETNESQCWSFLPIQTIPYFVFTWHLLYRSLFSTIHARHSIAQTLKQNTWIDSASVTRHRTGLRSISFHGFVESVRILIR